MELKIELISSDNTFDTDMGEVQEVHIGEGGGASVDIVQTTGNREDAVMSQKAVTELTDLLREDINYNQDDISSLNDRVNTLEDTGGSGVEIVQETGDREDAVMSQKAVSEKLNIMRDDINYNQADISWLTDRVATLEDTGGSGVEIVQYKGVNPNVVMSQKAVTDELNKIGGGGSVTLYRHDVLLDFTEYTALEGGTSPDNGLESIYVSFVHFSTSPAPIVDYSSTLKDVYDFAIAGASSGITSGSLVISGDVVVNGTTYRPFYMEFYENTLTFFGAPVSMLDVTTLKGDWSNNNGWDTVTQVT